jgi:hypothetical protein
MHGLAAGEGARSGVWCRRTTRRCKPEGPPGEGVAMLGDELVRLRRPRLVIDGRSEYDSVVSVERPDLVDATQLNNSAEASEARGDACRDASSGSVAAGIDHKDGHVRRTAVATWWRHRVTRGAGQSACGRLCRGVLAHAEARSRRAKAASPASDGEKRQYRSENHHDASHLSPLGAP